MLAPVSHLIMAGRWNFLVLLGRFSLASELFSYDFPPAEWRVPICKEVKAASAKAKEQEEEVKSRPVGFHFFIRPGAFNAIILWHNCRLPLYTKTVESRHSAQQNICPAMETTLP